MPTSPARPLLLLGLAYLGFVGLGLPDGLLGVAWPSIRGSFGLPLDALGPLLVATTSGYVLSSFLSGRILTRISVGMLLSLSCAGSGLALLGYAIAPAWGVLVGFGVVAGLGAGAIDAGINTHVATQHSARALNWAHACYGIGAAVGPALMTGLLMAGEPWQSGYAGVGVGVLVLGVGFLGTLALWPRPSAAPDSAASAGAPTAAQTFGLAAARWGCAAFFVYTGLEAAAGVWLYSLLTEARGTSMMAAGSTLSVYWGGLMAGRLVFGLIAHAAPLRILLRGCLGLFTGAAVLLALDLGPGPTLVAAGLLGLAGGPVFPSLIAATPERVGRAHAAHTIGFQVAAAALGQALLPAGIGLAAERFGLELIGPALVAGALLAFGIHEALAAPRPQPLPRPLDAPL